MQNKKLADELRAADVSTVYVERLLSFRKKEQEVEEKAFPPPSTSFLSSFGDTSQNRKKIYPLCHATALFPTTRESQINKKTPREIPRVVETVPIVEPFRRHVP